VLLKGTAYGKKSFPSKESDTKLLQSVYFAHEIDMSSLLQIESVSERLLKSAQRMLGGCMRLWEQCLRTIFQQAISRLPATMSQP